MADDRIAMIFPSCASNARRREMIAPIAFTAALGERPE
jgi:hypothetical protein